MPSSPHLPRVKATLASLTYKGKCVRPMPHLHACSFRQADTKTPQLLHPWVLRHEARDRLLPSPRHSPGDGEQGQQNSTSNQTIADSNFLDVLISQRFCCAAAGRAARHEHPSGTWCSTPQDCTVFQSQDPGCGSQESYICHNIVVLVRGDLKGDGLQTCRCCLLTQLRFPCIHLHHVQVSLELA